MNKARSHPPYLDQLDINAHSLPRQRKMLDAAIVADERHFLLEDAEDFRSESDLERHDFARAEFEEGGGNLEGGDVDEASLRRHYALEVGRRPLRVRHDAETTCER